MTPPNRPEDWMAYADAVAPRLDMVIDEAWKSGVASFLVMLADAAALFIDAPLDEVRDEAAPVFDPGNAP